MKKKYYPSKQYTGASKKFIKKNNREEIILLHRINIKGLNPQESNEMIIAYNNHLPQKFGNLNILNIVIPITTESSDIKLLYPDLKIVKSEVNNFLNTFQKRKLNIEILKQVL